GRDIFDLAGKIATHSNFPMAWAQKACFFANSAACSADDPEFQRVTGVFKTSGYDFKVLLREMLTSPLTTAAAHTSTFDDRGVVINVARRDSLCTALSNRLGVTDVCGLSAGAAANALQRRVAALATGVPSDGYSRGSVAPVLANDPS